MPLFRVRRRRSLGKTLRNVFSELVSRVQKELASVHPEASAVHEARKSVKRLRALVSLVAKQLNDLTKHFDHTLRDVNRTLSATRDATVAVTTLENLALASEDGLSNDYAAAKAALDRRLAEVRSSEFDVEREVLGPLKQLQQNWQRQDWPDDEWALLEPNLRKTYRRGRRMQEAIANGAPAEVLHDLRKRVKQTQYHLEFLMPIAQDRLQPEHAAWEQLADTLGQHHDLWVLQELLRTMPTKDLSRISRSLVLGQIRNAARKLEQQVAQQTPILYAERPRAFSARLEAYWQHWKRQQQEQRRREAS